MPDTSYVLSPYCVGHSLTDSDGIAVVHGLHGSRFELSLDLLMLVARLLQGTPLPQVLDGQSAGAREAIETLVAEQVLVERGADASGDRDPFRHRLDPIALAFHRGFNTGGYFPDRVDHEHPPASEKDARGRAIDLEIEPPGRRDASLVRCLAARRSIRAYAATPMDQGRLASFLELTARAHAVIDTPDMGRLSMRNYPSGGARYPLEVYPVVYDVSGLEPGIYYYHPFHHRLIAMDSEAGHRDELRKTARFMMGRPSDSPGEPAVLLVLTGVFARTCWKYRGIPYHLILQEVGALYQTMYLVAALLELAPCAVGAFPELAVTELLGLDSRDEAQVGLFALGLPADDGPSTPAIAAIRRVERSPFSPDARRPAVELRFADDRAEIMDLADLRVSQDPDGRFRCMVMRGRYRAELSSDMAAQLAAWSSRDGASATGDGGGSRDR
jgi:SagB-type dehydrogenase family enzyme